ncbi:MAG: hypothetical protein JWN29_3748 [Acidimicrobiales bacterium]|nr:hypothetical protein [Acidimicrobiales bacterium]
MDEQLFRVPPAEFIAARDAEAKRLRAEGDKEGAAAVKALRRPTVGAWAVNQVARDHPELVDAVVDAGARVVDAQTILLSGGDPADLRAATAARREAVGAASRAAVALAGPAYRDGITATFDAAAADEDAAAAVRTGRLTRELDPPSSFALLGVAPPEAPPSPSPPPPKIDEAALATARQRLDEARAAAHDAVRRAQEAASQAEAARAVVADAEAEVERLSHP